MKFKTTAKEVKGNNNIILGVPYCKMQYLLRYSSPVAYTSGAYGWKCDIYDIDGIIISTGYNYIESKGIEYNHDLITQYENEAREVQNFYKNNYDYSKRVEFTNHLLSDLLKKLVG